MKNTKTIPEPGTLVWYRCEGTPINFVWALGVATSNGIVPLEYLDNCWKWDADGLVWKLVDYFPPESSDYMPVRKNSSIDDILNHFPNLRKAIHEVLSESSLSTVQKWDETRRRDTERNRSL